MKVGVIGNGFVGNSIYHTFAQSVDVYVNDINPEKSTNTLSDVLENCDVVFVCLPTPMRSDGRQDISYINSAFQKINETLATIKRAGDDIVFVVKSTVVPGTTDRLIEEHGLNISFSPEFLTERTAVSDSICSNHVIIGGSQQSTEILTKLFRTRFGRAYNIFVTTNKTAEFIKYMRNTYFATKVTYMNEMFRVAANCEVDWEDAVSGFAMDGRIGHSHMSVPGHDGMYGYGGTCFPKDVGAIITHSEDLGFTPPVLRAVRDANLKYRGVEDWKSSVGRAVSEDE
jgi:UDPglucose 6-dehydrogenase